jgi:hypothetical protein
MIPFLLSWDTQRRLISLKWNGFFSLVWEKGKVLMKMLSFPIPFRLRQKKSHFHIQWIYLKELFSFLAKWKLRKVEGAFSLPDPMINGLVYGWIRALEAVKPDRKISVTINFLGENRFSGEAALSLKVFFHHLKRWVFLLLREKKIRRMRRKRR